MFQGIDKTDFSVYNINIKGRTDERLLPMLLSYYVTAQVGKFWAVTFFCLPYFFFIRLYVREIILMVS